MTGNQGRALPRGPAAVLDHALIPVLDLDLDAPAFAARYGLDVQPGGRHPGIGTANQLVPLGSTYLELIAVVDAAEAQTSARSRRVLEAARGGRPFATWAARTESIDALRGRLIAAGWTLPPPQTGARVRPDGVRLEWRSQDLASPDQASVLPFLIEWHVPPGAHPAEAPARHPSGARDIIRLHFTAPDPALATPRLQALLGEESALFDIVPGDREELAAIELAAPDGPIRIPYR